MANKLIIRDGIRAIYFNGIRKQPVILCNVKDDIDLGILFNARDQKTNALLTRNGLTLSWREKAITSGTFQIINPEYEEPLISTKQPFIVDELKKKKDYLRKFFKNAVRFNNLPFTLDDEQLTAVLTEQNSLITARAGSGKTRVLIAKLIYLFEHQHLNETNVLAFCFNKDAKLEIADRLNNQCYITGKLKYRDYDIAKTFHSFSLNALNISGKILVNRTKLIKLIINELRETDSNFSKNVYRFFKEDTLRIDRKNFHNTESYYKYIRNCRYTTLGGEKVKSRAEKYIADYLFEHGIEYVYEKSFFPYKISFESANLTTEEIKRGLRFVHEKKEIKPDFYLPRFKYALGALGADGKRNERRNKYF